MEAAFRKKIAEANLTYPKVMAEEQEIEDESVGDNKEQGEMTMQSNEVIGMDEVNDMSGDSVTSSKEDQSKRNARNRSASFDENNEAAFATTVPVVGTSTKAFTSKQLVDKKVLLPDGRVGKVVKGHQEFCVVDVTGERGTMTVKKDDLQLYPIVTRGGKILQPS